MKNQLDIGLLLLRLTFGGLMIINHGWGKMMKFFDDAPIKFADPFGIGETPSLALTVFAEVACAVLIIIGFLTRWATIPLIITMLVAAFIIHINDPFKKM
ncbi:MAG: DoxX family protein, partial [Bacteroidota bacterium]